MKLNIGGGNKKFEGFKNVDHDPSTNPDYLMKLGDPFPIDDNTVEEVKAHHILEHLRDEFFPLMIELYRVMKHNAVLDIAVPHHRHEIFFTDPTHIRPILVETMRMFDKEWNAYQTGMYNTNSNYGQLLDINFRIIEFDFELDDHWKARWPQMSEQDRDEVSRNFNNVYGVTNIKMVAIKDE